MTYWTLRGAAALETKFASAKIAPTVTEEGLVEGYASIFELEDQGGDAVAPGAFQASLDRRADTAPSVKFLWQHDPAKPIGIWTSITEDARGLKVRGRLLTDVQAGAEALSLLRAGAVEGLSIGYRTVTAEKTAGGGRRLLEVDLWEVSLVTFPMLPEARANAAVPDADDGLSRILAEAFQEAGGL